MSESPPLPFVLSIPHCSDRTPSELAEGIALTNWEMALEVDQGTWEIFGAVPAAATMVADWCRFVVDLNRAPDDFSPKGVVAHTTYHGDQVFKPGFLPDESAKAALVARYHRPFHQALDRALADPAVLAYFDCHSLNEVGPSDAPDAGQKRADLVIGNNGGPDGLEDPSREGPPTCGPKRLAFIKAAFEQAGLSVAVNQPFPGGWLTRHYGVRVAASGRTAMQLELNKGLFLKPGTADLDWKAIAHLRQALTGAFRQIAAFLSLPR